jgi:hypothetical protein
MYLLQNIEKTKNVKATLQAQPKTKDGITNKSSSKPIIFLE